jgi:hypothetical protein
VGCILALSAHQAAPALASAIGALPGVPQDSTRSTRSGAYTTAQATQGKELYAMHCVSCHTVGFHTSPAFVSKWDGRPLWELYRYVSQSMPKSEPGSLSPGEYSRLLAYLLKLNGAPAGSGEMTPDSTALSQIRIELQPR